MYPDFLFSLVVFSIAFRLLNIGVALATSEYTCSSMSFRAAQLSCSSCRAVFHLLLTVLALFGHAAGAGRTEDGSYDAMGAGAQWGAIGGLAIFVTLYIAPAASGWFPGLIPCVEVSFRLANWLVSFRLLRWAIGLYAAYLILNWVLLRCSVSAFGVGGLLSLLRRGKKTPEAPSAVDCEKEPVFPRAPPSDAVVATVKKARKTRRKFQKSERKGR